MKTVMGRTLKIKVNPELEALLPPLSTEEFDALKLDIKQNGVVAPILVDEDGTILDGHNRFRIDKNAPHKVIAGLSEEEKQAFVIRCNFARRNLSPDQRRETLAKMKRMAKAWREADPKVWTQEKVARSLGVARETVRDWFKSNGVTANTCNPDARVKLNADAQRVAAERVAAGEPQQQVAADFKVSQQAISNIVRRVKKEEERKEARKEIAAFGQAIADARFVHGDFVQVATEHLKDNTVDLLFTDPPYFTEYVPDYGRLAEVASRVLVDGGSLIAYCGHALVPQILEAMKPAGLRFFWLLGCIHTGQCSRMPRSGIVVTWKPMLWFVKGATRFNTQVFVNDSVVSQREKSAHDWQQSMVEASYYVDLLTEPDGIVFDPFCGGGTTAMACRSVGRNFLTCDVDAEALNVAKERFNAIHE